MPLIPPPIDLDQTFTRVKSELVRPINSSSTYLAQPYSFFQNDEFPFHLGDPNPSFSVAVKYTGQRNDNNSTWEEFEEKDFDFFIPLIVSETIKVRSKIKKISKYNPIIVLD